jgi:predicted Rossmann fold nucleotide-binding protein DprA/Smf involved in DNA uptake
LTEEDQDFMRTMEQVDAWLEAEIAEAQERKQQEIALRMLQENIPLDVIARITQLTISELEGFANEQLQVLQSQPGNN